MRPNFIPSQIAAPDANPTANPSVIINDLA